MTDIFATEAIEQARAAVDAARAAYAEASDKLDAFGPMPLLGTDAEIAEHLALTSDGMAARDEALAKWSEARKAYEAELRAAIVADQGYDNLVADIEAL